MNAHLNGVVTFRGVSPIQKAFDAGLEEAGL